MSEQDRNDFPNLILLCPTHHTLVDDLEPDRYTVSVLTKMKEDALKNIEADSEWTRDTDLIRRATSQLIVVMERLDSLGPLPHITELRADPIVSSSNLNAQMTGGVSVDHVVSRAINDESLSNDSL
jgi:hypothetical protein